MTLYPERFCMLQKGPFAGSHVMNFQTGNSFLRNHFIRDNKEYRKLYGQSKETYPAIRGLWWYAGMASSSWEVLVVAVSRVVFC